MWTLLLSRGAEHAGAAEHRDELLAGLGGRVIEVGAGNGLNFRHCPAAVIEVVALEPEPYLRHRAEQATAEAPVPVTVVAGVADALPADDHAFDAGVASLVLCSVPDQAAALHELRRVIRPGGELRFYEHVVARDGRAAGVQRGLDRSGIWPRVGAGCHLARDTVTAIKDAGFAIERCRRLGAGARQQRVPRGEGHAHLYLDGVKLTRLYGPAFYLGELQPGRHVIRVTLNGNDHGDYVLGMRDVAAETTVTVPEAAPAQS